MHPEKANRLIEEKSPYLLQHAFNPMQWYPWGDEAFAVAKQEDKPIFLSIGYATCHWCHVMERESFENEEVARLMNDTFVNIKVDREELPQVDNLYMEFAQALMSSAGGWPLNVVLTPDLKPFFAVTYLPAKSHHGLTGLDQFALQIKHLWQSDEKNLLIEQADRLVEIFAKAHQAVNEQIPSYEQVKKGVETIFELCDTVYGGMKGQPKFPFGYQSLLFLNFAQKKNDSRARFFVELSLDMMRRGGIYDHLGGGFSRYCVDDRWHIPHFEKMLYDNAILAKSYLEAWKATENVIFRNVAGEVLEYMLNNLRSKEGGFFCAEDADLQGQEGLYYTWSRDEVEEILKGADPELFTLFYGITYDGNLEGRNVLHIDFPLAEFAENFSVPPEELDTKLVEMRHTLLEKRGLRDRPFVDDKILASWNGLAIDAFATAGIVLGEEKYLKIAEQTAEFILKECYKEGILYHRYRDGEVKFLGNLDDYAFMIKAFLSLFSAGRGTKWLRLALEFTEKVEEKFASEKQGYFQTESQDAFLLRRCEHYDGAEPSGNGVHAENLLKLFQLTFDEKYRGRAEGIFKSAKGVIEAYPPGACYHLLALMRYYDKTAPTLVVVKGGDEKEITQQISSCFIPHVEVIPYDSRDEELVQLLPHLKDKTPIDGKTTFYLCDQQGCKKPVSDREEMQQLLKNL